jgi:NADH-quinone oxidoreductase subunit C
MSWPPSAEALEALGQELVANSAGSITSYHVAFGELNLTAQTPQIVGALSFLRDQHKFQQLIELAGVDYPERERRFTVAYLLLSLTRNLRVRLTVETDEDTAVPTVTGVYPNADWYEREAFDMYGVFFEGHPDLRRILTDYGFHGHPLRKDFPMTGYVELRYDDELKRVVYEPVKATEWRSWDFLSPWEGAERGFAALPGDEKAALPKPAETK